MRESTQREFRWFIELRKAPHNKNYTGEIYTGTKPENRIPLKGLNLGPDSCVRIKGIDTTLGEILKVLEERGAMSSNPEEERIFNALGTMEGQRDLGEYLYSQIWPNTPLDDIIQRGPSGGEIQTHVTIIACDDYTTKLPWVLMTYEGKKLVVHRNIGISVSLRNELREVQLGPKITFLIAAPNYETEDTRAEEHIQDIKMQLAMGNDLWEPKNDYHRVITVETWEEFKSVVKGQKPDIIYYYGHGDEGRLAFPDIPIEGRFGAASIDFAAFFKDMVDIRDRPKVVYVNCCRGHQGGSLNLGSMLEDLFPIVVINRTAAYVEEAQNQAISFFLNLLNKGLSPQEAVICMHRTKDLFFDAIQWWIPVFYRNYSTFYNRIEREGGLWIIEDWDLKINRTKQYSLVRTTVQDLLRHRRCGAASFVWYGERGQGILQFARRLEIQLPEDLDLKRNDRQDFLIIRPEWPTIKTGKGFIEAICNAFAVKEWRYIPAKISGEQRDRFNQGGPFLVIVSHQTIESCNEWTSDDLKTYLKLWDEFIIPLLDDSQYILLGISYEDEDYARIGSILQGIFGCPKIQDKDIITPEANEILILSNMYQMEFLDPFIHLNVRDIVDILKKNFPEWRPERLARYANQIHNQTGGHYMKTVIALQEFRDCFDV